MKTILKHVGMVALILTGLVMVFGSTGCSGHETWRRPGWIVPTR